MHEPYSALIIGAGNISALFDSPGDDRVLTHAHAVVNQPELSLAGFVDPDPDRGAQGAARWGGKAYQSLSEAMAEANPAIVAVAAPDDYHYAILQEIAGYKPRFVFAEKPVTKTLAEAQEIQRLYREAQMPIGVNYTRRFVPEIKQIHDEIKSGETGALLRGTGYYGKGFVHNGSHMIDLIRYLVGTPDSFSVMDSLHDYYDDDPTITCQLNYSNGGSIMMQGVDCRWFTIFELELLFERKRIRMIDAGFRIEVYEVREDPVFAGYHKLHLLAAIDTSMGRAMQHAYCEIAHSLTNHENFLNPLEEAIETMRLCALIQEEAR